MITKIDSNAEEILIDDLYQEVLDRPVDPDGLATYVPLLREGELTLSELRQILKDSPEYQAKFS